MAEPEEAKADAAGKADPPAEDKSSKKDKSGGEKTIGKFTHGDHMVHLLFQKGKKFIPLCEEDR